MDYTLQLLLQVWLWVLYAISLDWKFCFKVSVWTVTLAAVGSWITHIWPMPTIDKFNVAASLYFGIT